MSNPSEKKSITQRFLNALNIKTPEQKQDEKLLVAIKNLDIKNRDLIKNVAQAIEDGVDIHKKYSGSSLLQIYVAYRARKTHETHEEEGLKLNCIHFLTC